MSRLSGSGFLAWFVVVFLVYSTRVAGAVDTPADRNEPPERRVTIFYTSGIQGTLEPCGCTSDPLGGIDRFAALVRRTRKTRPVLLVDGGNLSFPATGLSAKKIQAGELRAAFLARQLTSLGLAGSALGPADLARGKEKVAPPRLASNLPAGDFTRPAHVIDVGGIKVGLLGIVDPAAVSAQALRADDPAAAAARDARRLRAEGADIVIAVAAIDRPAARKIARAAAIDFLVLGHNTGDGMATADRIGGAHIVAAGEELQRVGRLDLVVRRGGGPLQDAGGPEVHAARLLALSERIAALDKQIAAWSESGKTRPAGSVDEGFVAQKIRDRSESRRERERLAGLPWQAPRDGSYFTNQLIPMSRALPRDATIAVAMKGLDREIGKVNLAGAEPPPAAAPGRARYVGDHACIGCHKEAAKLWRATVHARAWRTLLTVGKQDDLECVGCHVTGYGEVGGSALGFTKGLQAVQCETCHGPGSIHVAEEGLEEKTAVRLSTPETVCLQCHTEKHSDTFNYVAYLRDVVGPGHGKKKRAELGQGPTGHMLRHAAVARAGKAGAELKKKF